MTTQQPLYKAIYRITFRDCHNMESTFTKDYTYTAHSDYELMLQAKYDLGHYGGIKAERIGEPIEITS